MKDKIEECYSKFCKTIESHNLFEDIDRFLVLFSCGKDCSMMLDLFLRYHREHNVEQPFTILSVPYPKHMYYCDGKPNDNFSDIVNYWNNRGVEIQYKTPVFDDFADDDRNGCMICKKSRKSEIDKFVNQCQKNTGILTGFTIYDALSYLNMIFLNCNCNIKCLQSLPEPIKSTTTKMLHKMSLRERLPSDKIMIRPMLPFNEQDVKNYLEITKIPYLSTPCKISKYKFKRLYSSALDLYQAFPVSYEGIENFLMENGIILNGNHLSFEDVKDDNYFVDC